MIRLENVSKTYKGDVRALSDTSLTIEKGEFVYEEQKATVDTAKIRAYLTI